MSDEGTGAVGFLARTRYGHVKRCEAGCTHLTFDTVSLHFESGEEFEAFAEDVLAQKRQSRNGFEVSHHFATLTLDPVAAHALAELVGAAAANLAWFRGDCHLTEAEEKLLLKGEAL